MYFNNLIFKEGEKIMAQRRILSIILLITLLIAYLDRVNVSVIVADSAFLQEMGLAGDAASAGLLMDLRHFEYVSQPSW